MRVALKCKHCGYLTISKEDDISVEIDFLEQKITYICPQAKCKKMNILYLSGGEGGGTSAGPQKPPLPRIGMISG
jgi:hypothetical protein